MAFTGTESQQITLTQASDLTQNFRDTLTSSSAIIAHYFAKKGLLDVLNQEDCVGIRIYYALSDAGVPQLVIVGVDANENDLYQGVILDQSLMCPTHCSSPNPLNT